MPKKIYLDESGDLGWKFDLPFGHGGSSKFLTIAYIVIPYGKSAQINRFVKKIYVNFGLTKATEFKASSMNLATKKYIAEKILALLNSNPDFTLGAITVSKEKVKEHLRSDSNKLYNYMIAQSVLTHVSSAPEALLIRDNRSVKVKSGNSCIDYLQMKLWYEMSVKTKITDNPSESHNVNGLIFIDWVTNFIWSYYEKKTTDAFDILNNKMIVQTMFF